MDIREISKALFKMPNVKAAILFGSQAKGKARGDSDIDICVITEDNNNSPLALSSEKVDISLFHKLPTTIRYRVFRYGKVLFSKDDIFMHKLKFWAITDYQDEQYWRDKFAAKLNPVQKNIF